MSSPHDDDLSLVRRALAGEPAARDELARRLRCIARFVGYISRRLGMRLTSEDRDDACQNVLTRVWEKCSVYHGAAALESWVFAICEGELRNLRRRLQRNRHVDLGEAEEPITMPDPKPDFDGDRLRSCLERLPADDSGIVRRMHFHGDKLREIAAALSLNLNTVKSRYYRALLMLRRCYDGATGN